MFIIINISYKISKVLPLDLLYSTRIIKLVSANLNGHVLLTLLPGIISSLSPAEEQIKRRFCYG